MKVLRSLPVVAAAGGGRRARDRAPYQRGSTFVIVLWIAFGLVSLALYFAQAMSFELRASDSRVAGLAAEQAIDGAIRYLQYDLAMVQTNGLMPDPESYLNQAVAVGQSHFWLISRETNNLASGAQASFGLVDEASKLNLNTATSNILVYLPGMTVDLVTAILDWRDTNGGSGVFQTYYGMHNPPYQNKGAPFESVDELKLLYGGDLYTLVGEDLNRNGVLDANEPDDNHNGVADLGVLDQVTVFSREPNTYSNGLARVDIRNVGATGPLASLLQSTFGQSQANRILTDLGVLTSTGPGGGPGRPGGGAGPGGGTITRSFPSPLAFYAASRMSADDFARIANALTVAPAGSDIQGRVNVNTASAAVLSCLPGLSDSPGLAQTLVDYRRQNPYKLTSIAWVVEALGQNNTQVLAALAARDCITTASYQFTADVAALGPHGRGYRRVRFVLDTRDGTARIIYRQDLTHLGWAMGKEVRQNWLLAKGSR